MNQIEIILHYASPDVMDELDMLMEIDREPEDWPNGYTLLDALKDLVDRCEANNWEDGSKPLRRNIRSLQVAIGMYREITQEEIARTVSTGKAWAFVLNGRKYTYNDNYKED